MPNAAWARGMAAYNSEMNRRIYRAAAVLEEEERRADGGAFFGSIHRTLSHLLWADVNWMSRFDGWEKPGGGVAGSPDFAPEWEGMRAARAAADAGIEAWAGRLTAEEMARDFTWFSGNSQAETTRPLWLLVAHMFNHQTHHRGQVHALLTRAGARPEATDLPWIVERDPG